MVPYDENTGSLCSASFVQKERNKEKKLIASQFSDAQNFWL